MGIKIAKFDAELESAGKVAKNSCAFKVISEKVTSKIKFVTFITVCKRFWP